MLVVVLVALRGAGVAGAGAKLEHFAKHRLVGAAAAQAQRRRRLADVGAVEADADALASCPSVSAEQASAHDRHIFAQYIA